VITRRILHIPVLLATLCLPAYARDPGPLAFTGGLDDLPVPRRGRAMHEGSWDRSGGNTDFHIVVPGQTIALFEHDGPGVVRRFWVTFFPIGDPAVTRQLILRMFWDGETSPSVETPLGDFFGVGFGETVNYVSVPLAETSGGYNCYWPMPFHRAARWTLENVGPVFAVVWYNIDFVALERLPRDVRHFHAQWRRENPTTAGKSYTILEAEGAGHFVGAALFMRDRTGGIPPFGPFGFLEGDERIFIDGETTPSIVGTGTEDYFGGAFYFVTGPYAAPFHGAPIKDETLHRVSAYRWHIADAIPFTRSIRVEIEHGPQNDHETDYSSVAYFYQTEPHAPFAPLPTDPGLLLP
jgi:hypothetical protein